MKNRLILAVLCLAAVPVATVAQPRGGRGGGFKPPEGPAPKNPWGKPDLNGVWQRPYVADVTRNGGPSQQGSGELPYTPAGKAEWDNYHPEQGDYTGSCLPFGYMRSVNSPDPMQIVQTDKVVAFLWEQNTWFKQVPIDGRPHGKKVPTWFGDSVGKWEDDTLVIDTNNFNGLTKLDTIGHPHSDQLHMIERYTRTDAGHIGYEVTVEDSKTYTKPWKNTRVFTIRPDWEILEYSCEENNKGLIEGRIKVPATEGPAKK